MTEVPIIIIGAGPAGLAMAGRLDQLGIEDYIVIESSSSIGSSWRNHYDRLHLHTVKKWSHLPHFPFPEAYPTYVSRQQVVEYLDAYAVKFNIEPRLNESVTQIEKEASKWKVTTSKEVYLTDHVVVATGINKIPNMPTWPGQDAYVGEITHSKYYKNPEPYKGHNVLIVGMGNTGSEVALDLANHDVPVHLSVRSPISLVPRDLNGRPVQETAKTLAKIPFGLGDWLGSQIRKIYFGNVEKYGLRISKMHPTVQLTKTGKTPVIDLGTIDMIKKGKVKVLSDIQSFYKDGVLTTDGEQVEVSRVILATGYRAEIEKMMPNVEVIFDSHNLPNRIIGTEALDGSYFLGFDNYKLGGILGTIYNDSEVIAEHIQSKLEKQVV